MFHLISADTTPGQAGDHLEPQSRIALLSERKIEDGKATQTLRVNSWRDDEGFRWIE